MDRWQSASSPGTYRQRREWLNTTSQRVISLSVDRLRRRATLKAMPEDITLEELAWISQGGFEQVGQDIKSFREEVNARFQDVDSRFQEIAEQARLY